MSPRRRIQARRVSSSRMPVAWSTAIGKPATESRGIEHEQERLRPAGQGGQAMEPVGDLRRGVAAGESTAGQVQHEQVDRATGEQAAGDRQPLVEAVGRDDHEPFEAQAAGDGLDRVEAARQVQPGDDRALRLRFGGDPVGERRPPARAVAPDGHAGRGRQTTRAEDGVEGREAGPDDALAGERGDEGLGGGASGSAGSGTRASAPRVRGAAAPQRAWRPATASSTAPRGVVIGRLD